jgi:hypothetical protein
MYTRYYYTEWNTHSIYSNLYFKERYILGLDLTSVWTYPSIYIFSTYGDINTIIEMIGS